MGELNEGVNRIYDEMADFYLNELTYSQPNPYALQLKLENNYASRRLRMDDHVDDLEKNQTLINSMKTNEKFWHICMEMGG